MDVGLVYGRGDTVLDLTCYSNLDYTRDLDGRRSLPDYVFTVVGSFICWKASYCH